MIYKVKHSTMNPQLSSGDRIIVLNFMKPKEGKLVVTNHKGIFKIKRIHKIEGDKIFLKGDNEHPDKDMFITKSEIVGRVFTLPKFFRS
ncbi:S24/S26 family peptidase [Candidatus Woesearchaeota archaeon]|jgi:phage repressor protein C with HTH and peptisase S24 domain|nr:S24/S26 family peptidase [Candidatus Woesearchaeota archaeon]MBT6023400.1 S24/S26 family peptidase [Candidatus Woesearchaeota archaeon]